MSLRYVFQKGSLSKLTIDMDGTLLNTEDIYTEATTELLARYGKGPMTWDVKIDLQGRPGTDATKIVIERYGVPISPEQFMKEGFDIQELKWHRSAFIPGALELLQHLKEQNIPIALGTSSNSTNYHRKTSHLQHGFSLFEEHVVRGDDTRIAPGRGKPNPDIWLVCLESINAKRIAEGLEIIDIEECLVFEDGIPGVISGVRAKATVVWIPHPEALKVLNGKEKEIIGNSGEILESILHFDKAKYGL